MAKIRIGFVGAGNMGQMAHLKNYVLESDCEIVALAELRTNTGTAVAQRYGIPALYSNAAAMLAKEKLDAIVASQPFDRHGVLVPELLQAGIPLFIEKPLAASIAVGNKIIAAEKQSGTFIMPGYHKRSDPAVMYAKREIDALKASGELGRMKYVRLLMPAGDWIATGFDGMLKIKEDSNLPAMERDPQPDDMHGTVFKEYMSFVNYYIHQVNLMRHLLGESYRATYAEASGVLFAGQSESGIACTIEMSPYQTTIDWQEQAMVCFEKGWIRIGLPAPLASNRPGSVEIFKDPGNRSAPQTVIPQLPWVHAMRQQARNFIAAVKGDMPPMTTATEALEDLKVAREYIRLKTGK